MNRLAPLLLLAAGLAGLCCDVGEAPREDSFAEAETSEDDDETAASPDLGAVTGRELLDIDPEDNQACVDCHPDAAQTWEGSLHQRAWIEPAFQDSYAREPLAFCRGCHAPRADPAREPPDELAALGVDCISCHVRDGEVHTGPLAATAASAGLAPHAIVRSPDFGEQSCGTCHQFEFPRKAHRRPGALMQKTLLEHERSEWAELDCADCHMPAREDGPGRDHGLSISRNPELLRASLHAEVERVGDDRLRFSLEPLGVGHSFPTGDLFRRLELRAEVLDADGEVVDTRTRYLGRQFAASSSGHRRFPDEIDDRLTGPASVELALPRSAAGNTVRWSVTYQRVDSRDHAHPERSKLAGQVRLAHGEVPAPRRARESPRR